MAQTAPTTVLVVSDKIAASPELLQAIRARAESAPISLRLRVPNPAPAEWHPTHPDRHAKAGRGRQRPASLLGKSTPSSVCA
jgi:hypothetical protein